MEAKMPYDLHFGLTNPEIDMIVGIVRKCLDHFITKEQAVVTTDFAAIITMRKTFSLVLMKKAVHLIGRQDAVYQLADRLKRAGATFTENKGQI